MEPQVSPVVYVDDTFFSGGHHSGGQEGENISDGRVYSGVQIVLREGGQGDKWEAVHMIRFGSYNTCNGQKGGIESALRGMSQANVELGIFQDMEFTRVIYKRE